MYMYMWSGSGWFLLLLVLSSYKDANNLVLPTGGHKQKGTQKVHRIFVTILVIIQQLLLWPLAPDPLSKKKLHFFFFESDKSLSPKSERKCCLSFRPSHAITQNSLDLQFPKFIIYPSQ